MANHIGIRGSYLVRGYGINAGDRKKPWLIFPSLTPDRMKPGAGRGRAREAFRPTANQGPLRLKPPTVYARCGLMFGELRRRRAAGQQGRQIMASCRWLE